MRQGIARQAWSVLVLATLVAASGCLGIRTHKVEKTVIAPNLQSSTLEQLMATMDAQYGAIRTLNASIEIAATLGGEYKGEVQEVPSFSGYMFLRKPADFRVLLLIPVVRSRAFDMVSDGANFKLLVPPKSRAIEGSDVIVDATDAQLVKAPGSMNAGLEALRPIILREALVIPPLTEDQNITLTEGKRLTPAGKDGKGAMEEPDYNITILRKKHGQVLERVRVIRIGRSNLKPYQQDIYDHQGHIVTTVMYSNYQKTGDVEYPMSLLIKRPIDELTLKMDITKLQINSQVDDDQFMLKFPENLKVEKVN